jgi:hypothetical protein
MSLLSGIKLHHLSVSSFEPRLNGDDIIWDNGVIEVNHEFEIVHILKFPSYGDYNSTSVFYLRSNLGSNCFVQTHVSTSNTESETMSNINIFMHITNALLPNLPITYVGGDYKNDCYTSALTSGGYIELVDANQHPIDLLYPLRLSLLVEFY